MCRGHFKPGREKFFGMADIYLYLNILFLAAIVKLLEAGAVTFLPRHMHPMKRYFFLPPRGQPIAVRFGMPGKNG